jgi:3-dehydroquinate synthase
MQTLRVETGQSPYNIYLGSGIIQQPAFWSTLNLAPRGLLISNPVVAQHYQLPVQAGLGQKQNTVAHLVPDGESFKSLSEAEKIWRLLAQEKFTRDSQLIALGGGVIGDLTGFAAANFMRGIDFIGIPTTLLAMVDSSVGGKTGINLPQGKNLVGAFWQPGAVIMDVDVLRTLPDREYRSGLAEVIKYGAIGDKAFLQWLDLQRDHVIARETDILLELIARCVKHKAAIVERDPRESGERALLNFGHTFGHAIETLTHYTTYLHGEAVAIGMVLAARFSVFSGSLETSAADQLADLLTSYGLPVELPSSLLAMDMLVAMRGDKKNTAQQMRLILLQSLGHAVIQQVGEESILKFLQSVQRC